MSIERDLAREGALLLPVHVLGVDADAAPFELGDGGVEETNGGATDVDAVRVTGPLVRVTDEDVEAAPRRRPRFHRGL